MDEGFADFAMCYFFEVKGDQDQRLRRDSEQAGFELEPEIQMTEAEKAESTYHFMLDAYSGTEQMNPDLPQETMLKIVAKALGGEPLTIVYSVPASPEAKAQQEQMTAAMDSFLAASGIKADVLFERRAIKKALKTQLKNYSKERTRYEPIYPATR
ncbi:hypothetical protein NDS46_14950 [Paenibacillus thiaminolyticus]|uniref:hypothetical protein n=1 Tax=Paenibacillus thiaminolyticus TaxID=49283 RepID=UPI00232F727C|nr:hypothetical protein [Paenibacillus thiaminolyticus]WCF05697.1 hypothetical protein NDS46_14950 [Paenibacillus thiaminolyticus]